MSPAPYPLPSSQPAVPHAPQLEAHTHAHVRAEAAHAQQRARRRRHTTMVTASEFREIVASRAEGRAFDARRAVQLPLVRRGPAYLQASPSGGRLVRGSNAAAATARPAAAGTRGGGATNDAAAEKRQVSVLLTDDELGLLESGRARASDEEVASLLQARAHRDKTHPV